MLCKGLMHEGGGADQLCSMYPANHLDSSAPNTIIIKIPYSRKFSKSIIIHGSCLIFDEN